MRERAQGRNWSLKTSRTWIISLQFSTLASLQLWVPFPSLSLFLNYLFRFQLSTFVILFCLIISVERLNSGSLGFILGFLSRVFMMLTCINMNITSFQRNFSSNRTGLKQMISTCLLLKAICCIRASGFFIFFCVYFFHFYNLAHYLLHCTIYPIEKNFFLENLEWIMYKYSWFKVNQTFWR